MALGRNWLGQKQAVCDGCGHSQPLWKVYGWMVRSDGRIYHADCPDRPGGGYQPLQLL